MKKKPVTTTRKKTVKIMVTLNNGNNGNVREKQAKKTQKTVFRNTFMNI